MSVAENQVAPRNPPCGVSDVASPIDENRRYELETPVEPHYNTVLP